jgi:DNA-binding transcriptional LysR family regulator
MSFMQDLNLLRVLCAVIDCGTVTAAAGKLGVSQPTVSQALARLRDLTGDPLFTRDVLRMAPTAHAIRLYKECALALEKLENALRSDLPFDYGTTEAHFTIALSDLGEMTFLPLLVERLSRDAPGVRLDILPMNVVEIDALLKNRRIDFAVGKISSVDPEILSRSLFEETYTAIFRRGHPRIGSTLTLETFLSCGHAVVTDTSGHWQVSSLSVIDGTDPADIHVNLPHFTALPFVVSSSDLLAVVPSSTAVSFAGRWDLDWRPLPFELPQFKVQVLWNGSKSARSAERKWMIEVICDALRELGPYSPAGMIEHRAQA